MNQLMINGSNNHAQVRRGSANSSNIEFGGDDDMLAQTSENIPIKDYTRFQNNQVLNAPSISQGGNRSQSSTYRRVNKDGMQDQHINKLLEYINVHNLVQNVTPGIANAAAYA
jgi:hypothetical protein